VARQLATGKKCLVIRNGWFSYRWTQIFEMGGIPAEAIVMQAVRTDSGNTPAFAPAPIEKVKQTIRRERPDLVFAPHVETSAGILLPDDYIRELAGAVHEAGGLLVLDGIASGTILVDMQATGVDVLISAPQKGWSGSPCCGLVMMNEAARKKMEAATSSSFACDLLKWHQIMQAYENGGHAYHATMPTDALAGLRDVLHETEAFGFEPARTRQQELGARVRKILTSRGYKSVAAEGFLSPSVVVSYTDDPDIQSGKKFIAAGMQIAPGVPLKCGEPEDFRTFRIGLFGLDKLKDPDLTVTKFEDVLNRL
jgi:aspartate aminotransferase-like enzyme